MRSKEFNKVKPYVYIIKNKSTGLKYFGVRWRNTHKDRTPFDDLGKEYFSSNPKLKKAFSKNPKNFEFKPVYTFNSKKEAILYELNFNKKIIKSKKWLNTSAFPQIIHTPQTKKKISKTKKILIKYNDLKLLKNFLDLENYDFNQVIKKYFLDYSIVALIFKDNNEIKVLSKIYTVDKKVIKSNSFQNIDYNNEKNLNDLISELKIIYEDFWKDQNLINTSIKLTLSIKLDNKDYNLTSEFEKTLNEVDLISNYFISKFNNDHIFYEIIFNGTTNKFINIMKRYNYIFDTQKKVWILK